MLLIDIFEILYIWRLGLYHVLYQISYTVNHGTFNNPNPLPCAAAKRLHMSLCTSNSAPQASHLRFKKGGPRNFEGVAGIWDNLVESILPWIISICASYLDL